MNVLIVASGNNKSDRRLQQYVTEADYIIAADGGYDHLLRLGIEPDILVGDFDSLKNEPADFMRKVKLPCEKDETDSLYALRFAFSKGAKKIVLYGGIGSRFDHSYANVCLLQQAMVREIPMVLTDGETELYLTDSSLTLEKQVGTVVSVYAFGEVCEGVTLRGVKYPLEGYTLEPFDILGTSNEFASPKAEFSVMRGNLLIICNETKPY